MESKKIAYLILAHTDPVQLQRLITTLNYNCDYYVHIDAFADISQFNGIKLPTNAVFIKDRVKVNWAGFSIVKATLNLIRAADDSRVDYSHLILLSGMDYPIKPPSQIANYLNENYNKQFIKFTYMEDSPEWYMPMLNRYYFRDNFPIISHRQVRRVIRYLMENSTKFLKRDYLPNIKPSAGSQWWALTLDCAKYVLKFVDDNPRFVKFYRNAFVPDEHFFHTIVANSRFVEEVAFYKRNTLKGPHEFANLHIIHPSLQKVYQVEDFEEVKNSEKFFVRKVNSQKSKELLDKIDVELLSLNYKLSQFAE